MKVFEKILWKIGPQRDFFSVAVHFNDGAFFFNFNALPLDQLPFDAQREILTLSDGVVIDNRELPARHEGDAFQDDRLRNTLLNGHDFLHFGNLLVDTITAWVERIFSKSVLTWKTDKRGTRSARRSDRGAIGYVVRNTPMCGKTEEQNPEINKCTVLVHHSSLASVGDIHRGDDFDFEQQFLGVRRSCTAASGVWLDLDILDAHIGKRVLEV